MSYNNSTQNSELPPILGNGWVKNWENAIDVDLSVNREKMLKFLETVPVDDYGNFKLKVKQTKLPNVKSKATHILIENTYNSQKISGNNRVPNNNINVDNLDVKMPF